MGCQANHKPDKDQVNEAPTPSTTCCQKRQAKYANFRRFVQAMCNPYPLMFFQSLVLKFKAKPLISQEILLATLQRDPNKTRFQHASNEYSDLAQMPESILKANGSGTRVRFSRGPFLHWRHFRGRVPPENALGTCLLTLPGGEPKSCMAV